MFFLKCGRVTVWGLKDVGKLFCERKLCRFCERELLPHCFLMRSKEFFFFFPYEKLERERERVGKKEKGRKEKKIIFYSIGGLFKERKMFGVAIIIATVLSSSRELL